MIREIDVRVLSDGNIVTPKPGQILDDKEHKLRALADDQYAKTQYRKDMSREALYAEVDRNLKWKKVCAGEKWKVDRRFIFIPYEAGPPKKDDLQAYIALYCAEKDDKYLNWFFHYYEPRLNTIVMQTVQENAMQGHFADLKQSYVCSTFSFASL